MKLRALSSAVLLAFSGCSTVAPVNVAPPSQIAFDGPYQDAGILNVEKAVDGRQIGLRVTAFYVSKYRERVKRFGSRLSPTLTLDNCMDGTHFMPDVPGRGETWFVPDALQFANSQMAVFERNAPK